MKKMIFVLLLAVISFIGCTQNERARSFGSTETVSLNHGEKLVNITWKGNDMWILIELTDGSKEFREYSAWGVMNGKIKIVEVVK